MLSASNQFARGVFFDIVRLIRWLFSKYFTDIPYSLEALLLLPGLFTQATTADYGAAYAFLKELDYKRAFRLIFSAKLSIIETAMSGLRANKSMMTKTFLI
ncbi:MAG: hypothetical protein V7K26_06625 [Nostoc sp.]|uniref:hypothetical protein n=1 Tax=Nostoc sp. TaxID=1180 RepID=UPI002FF0270E